MDEAPRDEVMTAATASVRLTQTFIFFMVKMTYPDTGRSDMLEEPAPPPDGSVTSVGVSRRFESRAITMPTACARHRAGYTGGLCRPQWLADRARSDLPLECWPGNVGAGLRFRS